MNEKNEIIPNIRLTGKWLEQAGFSEGQQIEVKIEHGKIQLKLNPTKT